MISESVRSLSVTPNTWIEASWDEFLAATEDPAWETAHFYFDNLAMKVEMTPIGFWHSRNNSVVFKAISLFAGLNQIDIIEMTNGSFRLEGKRECQPDIAFYIGQDIKPLPQQNKIVDLETVGPPQLAIEIAASSLSDDLGRKRLLYEQLGVQEYWVIDVNQTEVIAFNISEGRSGRIYASQVLPGLELAIVEKALQMARTENDSTITRWLLKTFANTDQTPDIPNQ